MKQRVAVLMSMSVVRVVSGTGLASTKVPQECYLSSNGYLPLLSSLHIVSPQ